MSDLKVSATVSLDDVKSALGATGYDVTPKPPELTLTAEEERIPEGLSTLLEWSTRWASSVLIFADDDVLLSSSRQLSSGDTPLRITPSKTTTYRVECSGPGGTATLSVTVEVVPRPTLAMTVDPAAINPGGAATITMTSQNADSVKFDDSLESFGAVRVVSPTETTTYTARAVGFLDTSEPQSVTVTVVPAPPPPPPPPPSPSGWTIAPHGQRLLISDQNLPRIVANLKRDPATIPNLVKTAKTSGWSAALLLRTGLADPANVAAYQALAIKHLTDEIAAGKWSRSGWDTDYGGVYFACIYDWLYNQLTSDLKVACANLVATQLDPTNKNNNLIVGYNAWAGGSMPIAIALAESDADPYVKRQYDACFDWPTPHFNYAFASKAFAAGGCPEGYGYAAAWAVNYLARAVWKFATGGTEFDGIPVLEELPAQLYWLMNQAVAPSAGDQLPTYLTEKFGFDGSDDGGYLYTRIAQCCTASTNPRTAGIAAWLIRNELTHGMTFEDDVLCALLVGNPDAVPKPPDGLVYENLESCKVYAHTTHAAHDLFASFEGYRVKTRVSEMGSIAIYSNGLPLIGCRAGLWSHYYAPDWTESSVVFRRAGDDKLAFNRWNVGNTDVSQLMPAMRREDDGSYTVEFTGNQFNAVTGVGVKNTAIKLLRRNWKFDGDARTVVVKDHAECDPSLLAPWACFDVWGVPALGVDSAFVVNEAETAQLLFSGAAKVVSVGGTGAGWRTDVDGTLGGRDADCVETQKVVDAGGPFAWGCLHVKMQQVSPGVFELVTTVEVSN